MKIRNVDSNWDWKFGRGTSDYVKESYAVARNIQMALKSWYYDCFFDLDAGIPWKIRLGAKNQKNLLDRDIVETVQAVDGVLNVYDFQSSLEGRQYKCSFSVYQQYSTESLPITFDTERF